MKKKPSRLGKKKKGVLKNKFGYAKPQMRLPPPCHPFPHHTLHAPHHHLPPPVAFPSPMEVENAFLSIREKKTRGGQTDGWTNRRTDPQIKNARKHLKYECSAFFCI